MLKVIFALAAVVQSAAAGPQSFSIGTVDFTVRPPAGFCMPSGKAAAAIEMTSRADEGNVTSLALVRCEDKDASNPDYYLVKTPKSTVDGTFERTAFLAELVQALALPAFNTDRGMVDNAQTERRFEEVVGQHADINGAIKPLGHDDVCAYMGGVLTFTSAAVTYSRAVSLCLTVVGGKVIGVTRYSEGATPSNVVKHFVSARALALAIRPKR